MATKAGVVHCRICKQEIIKENGQEGIDWIQPSKNWYYHPKCYEDFAKKKTNLRNDIHADVDNDLWFSALYDYLHKDLKMILNMQKTKSQWSNFLKKGYTAKGIYFCMRYFYEVQHGDPSKGDGIGIVSYIYTEGCQYWIEREDKDKGICAKIEAQIRHASEQPRVVIQQKPKKKVTPTIDLSAIAEMGDDDN